MKNKNGFTLVELLAVIMIIGIISVLFIAPNVWRYFNTVKGKLSEYEKKELMDAAKTYATNLRENGYNLVTTKEYGRNSSGYCIITNTREDKIPATYHTGTGDLSGYSFVEYAAQNDLEVTAEYLVKNGYYNNGCIYNHTNECEKSTGCKVDKECTLRIHFNTDVIKANPSCNLDDDSDPNTNCKKYYSLKDFTISIVDENKCAINK